MSGSKALTIVALAFALALAPSAGAQQTGQVALIDGDAVGAYRAAGVVTAEEAATSSTLPKQKLDQQLRAEAAKLGADAVIHVTYQMTGAAHTASGVAIRYTQPATQAVGPSAAPAAAPQPAAAVPAQAVAAQTGASVSATPAAPAPTVHASAPAMVELSESSMQGRRFVRLAPVSAVAHQKSMFPKVPPKQQVDDALRAEAFKAGADAVIEVKYEMANAMFSKKGNRATGVAIRFE